MQIRDGWRCSFYKQNMYVYFNVGKKALKQEFFERVNSKC